MRLLQHGSCRRDVCVCRCPPEAGASTCFSGASCSPYSWGLRVAPAAFASRNRSPTGFAYANRSPAPCREPTSLDISYWSPHAVSVLSVGDKAPDFDGIDQAGRRWTLDELVKDSSIVLYFYPKDFTPVCTKEACLFRDAYEELSRSGIKVVGVSTDDADTHAKFAEHHRLPFPLLSDPEKRIASAYQARQLLGLFSKRVTYVIDREKRVRAAFHHELSAQKHLDAVRQVAIAK